MRCLLDMAGCRRAKVLGATRGLKPSHFYPLVGFVVPTLVLGYGFVIPGTCVAGLNVLSLSFAQVEGQLPQGRGLWRTSIS